MKANKIIETINDKREKYITMYRTFPKRIEISNKYLIELYLHFLYLQDIPFWEVKTLYGMEIIRNDNIKKIKDIKVY